MPVEGIMITGFTVRDLRWPTSLDNIGTDPMNLAGENSFGYLQYQTNTGLVGTGWSFANGQGNDVLCTAIRSLAPRFVGRSLPSITSNMGETQRKISSGQIRFMSPERGVLQLATNAVLNAIWDLWAKAEGKPLWRLVVDFTPEEFVRTMDFRYVTDALTPEQALEMLKKMAATKAERMQLALQNKAIPAYNTSAGWLGHSDSKVRELLQSAMAQGFRHFKLKAGLGIEADRKRLGFVREVVGDDGILMVDVNQLWDVDEAIEYMKKLADLNLWFIEEPTSPDDILGHAKIRSALKPYGIGVATGEHINNRVMFKQLLQAEALDAVQLDACRLASVNEILTVLLMSAKFGVAVVPHSGGAGMVELCSHISTIDFIVVSGKGSILEYTDHLHEAFEAPATITPGGYHVTPTVPGYSCDVKEAQFKDFECPNGAFWSSSVGQKMLGDPWRGVPGEQTS
ncbi:L-galactonate dehydratase [Pochonia chlamydosporia 170]|uniref:L-galactonate dehydratase n=1 Tax=Pochonia chlamydosporia 170 TaxID=1380566 RepID=A0A179FF59_METCM|nr:L-galactonate dehydratase [Pochonia chlamydosporia 170]OAQ63689.1 L-galactonate dehydratase [Pochonia chlamydosporia 170]